MDHADRDPSCMSHDGLRTSSIRDSDEKFVSVLAVDRSTCGARSEIVNTPQIRLGTTAAVSEAYVRGTNRSKIDPVVNGRMTLAVPSCGNERCRAVTALSKALNIGVTDRGQRTESAAGGDLVRGGEYIRRSRENRRGLAARHQRRDG